MPDLLDLTITLAPPPVGSPREAIASIALRCDALGVEHTGDLLVDPITVQEHTDLIWYLEEYWKWPFEGFAERGSRVEALLSDIGKRLYRAAFSSPGAVAVAQGWRLQASRRGGSHSSASPAKSPPRSACRGSCSTTSKDSWRCGRNP